MSAAGHVMIAAGGTGGHMFPAQALAETMLRRGWRVTLSTDARGARYASGFPEAVTIKQVASATFARGGLIARVAVPFRIFAGVLGAIGQLRRLRPNIVVGFGGYPSIPAMAAAWLTGLPRLIHEQNGVLGRVNQIFAKRVPVVACGTWPTDLPAGARGLHTGNPVRSAVLAHAGSPYTPPGEAGPIRLVAMGGSQGARILSDTVPAALAQLPGALRARLEVSHQARVEDAARVRAAYADAGITAEIEPFFADIPERLAASHLVIARSGASSVADIAVIGRPAIFIPLAIAIRDEQTANARGMVDAGAAILIPEKQLTPDALSAQIVAVFSNADGAARMAQAARSVAVADAADRLADLVEQMVRPQNEGDAP